MLRLTRPHLTGNELEHLSLVLESGRWGGGGDFTHACEQWIEATTGSPRALLTTSGTAALEMAALLLGVGPGDEIIMPSFTFASTANAFALRGATPVFVDIDPQTWTLDVQRVEAARSARTRAIVPVHYGGTACNMGRLTEISRMMAVPLVEDAAQGFCASWEGRALGTIGALGAISFHETKNVSAGEAGALLINDPELITRAEILREKGTDRASFLRGEIDRYTWRDLGSSYAPSEFVAAVLLAQLRDADAVTARRCALWFRYHAALAWLEARGQLWRYPVNGGTPSNGHVYAVLMSDARSQAQAIAVLRTAGIVAAFHYVPLHDSPAGRRYGRAAGPMTVTDQVSKRLVRLPLWADMHERDVDRVVDILAGM